MLLVFKSEFVGKKLILDDKYSYRKVAGIDKFYFLFYTDLISDLHSFLTCLWLVILYFFPSCKFLTFNLLIKY